MDYFQQNFLTLFKFYPILPSMFIYENDLFLGKFINFHLIHKIQLTKDLQLFNLKIKQNNKDIENI